MGGMFAWATPEYLLEKMSLDQIIYYYNIAWEARETEAKIYWGTYGALLNGPDTQRKNRRKEIIQTREITRPKQSIDEVRKTYSGYENAYLDEHGHLVRG